LVPHLTRLAALPCEEARQRRILAELSRPSGGALLWRASSHATRANTAASGSTAAAGLWLNPPRTSRDALPPRPSPIYQLLAGDSQMRLKRCGSDCPRAGKRR